MASLKYTHGVVCRVPLSFRSKGEISYEEAKRQHEAYVRLLRDIGLDVIELPPDESLPECIYVEDTAVVCNGIALITRPGNPTRQKEVATVKAILKKELDMPIVEISDENAKLDGGDVLFTGREFFVGLSKYTNEAGARAVASAFPEYPCMPIKVNDTEHLKSLISMAGPDVLCVSTSTASQEVLKRIAKVATYNYQTLTVPESKAANVLYINGTLIHRSPEEIPESSKVFAEKIDFSRHSLNVSELVKGNSGSHLSSCCLLLKRVRQIRSL